MMESLKVRLVKRHKSPIAVNTSLQLVDLTAVELTIQRLFDPDDSNGVGKFAVAWIRLLLISFKLNQK
jgi:hypothetical protein